jgi:hypothetical protein
VRVPLVRRGAFVESPEGGMDELPWIIPVSGGTGQEETVRWRLKFKEALIKRWFLALEPERVSFLQARLSVLQRFLNITPQIA